MIRTINPIICFAYPKLIEQDYGGGDDGDFDVISWPHHVDTFVLGLIGGLDLIMSYD